MPISSKKRILVFALFLAIAFGAGFFLMNAIKNSGSAKLPFSKVKLASFQEKGTDYTTKINTANGIDIRLANATDFGITLPKTLAEPIIIPLPNNRLVEISDQSEENKKAELISKDEIQRTDQNAKLLDIIQKDPSLAAYQTEKKDKTIFYSYQGNPSGEGRGKFKNWVLYTEGNDTQSESYLIQKAKITLDQNGNAKIYAEDETNSLNQNPDFTIPKPYFIDKDGQQTTLDWELDENANTLAVKITAKQNQYPLIFDPTIEFDATVISMTGNVQMSSGVTLSEGRPFYCGDIVTGKSPDVLAYGTVWGADGKCWLDRNLGATQVATFSTDYNAYGSLFQWGRAADGHQLITCTSSTSCTAVNGTTAILATTDTPGHANFIYTGFVSPYDWRSDNNNNRWATGANNPCPTGFHVPTSAEWTTLKAAAPAITNSATALSSTLKLPLAGIRFDDVGSLGGQGSNGNYWSSSISGAFALNMYFTSSSANVGAGFRDYGLSVRCVRDVTPPARPVAPAFFNFTDQTGVNPSTLTTSDIKQITGLSAAAAVSISGDGTPEYRICTNSTCSSVDHTWSSSAGSIDNNQYLQLRLTSSASCPTTYYATVVVGDGNNKWSVKTVPWMCGCSVQGLSPDVLTYGTVTGADGKCWLDRNLGATQVATAYNDYLAYGSLFQWGRLTDGHELRTCASSTVCTAVNGTTTTASSSDVPGHSNFIINSAGNYDWRSPQNNNLWQGVSGINNPCPTGFRVPTSTEWGTIEGYFSPQNRTGAYNSALKITIAGYHQYQSSTIDDEGIIGYYWSNTVNGSEAQGLIITSTESIPVSHRRAKAFSVRCLKN